jgi:MFS family permease
MVAAGSGLRLLNAALIQQSFGAYVAVLRDDLGWSKTSFSLAFSMQQVVGGLLGPIQGWVFDRVGSRVIMRISLGSRRDIAHVYIG